MNELQLSQNHTHIKFNLTTTIATIILCNVHILWPMLLKQVQLDLMILNKIIQRYIIVHKQT